jgi:hypothetical protein
MAAHRVGFLGRRALIAVADATCAFAPPVRSQSARPIRVIVPAAAAKILSGEFKAIAVAAARRS